MMRFELVGGLIILPVLFEYSPTTKVSACALIDTGSAGTALDIRLLTLEPSRPCRIVQLAGIGGNQDVVIQKVAAVHFSNQVVPNFEVEFGDVATKFGFEAIIGSDLLDTLGACVDYERHEIRCAQGLALA